MSDDACAALARFRRDIERGVHYHHVDTWDASGLKFACEDDPCIRPHRTHVQPRLPRARVFRPSRWRRLLGWFLRS